ncbi:MAG: hypothetical protein OHK0015_07270 [Chloroflexi bacterium OHK40]
MNKRPAPQPLNHRHPQRRSRFAIIVIAGLIAALATSGLVAFGAFHNNGQDGLAAVGPVASEHGFPVWYKDTNNVRLELCLDIDTYCLLTNADVPFPDQPLSVHTGNFPAEAFWMAADSFIEVPGGVNAALVLALEAAFANENPIQGDQVAFGRVRIRVENLQLGQTYRITHPYGVDTFTVEEDVVKDINFTEDIGIGAYTGPLNSRIGPFLRWDPAVSPAAPTGYIGDPGIEHPVIGSPYNTNFFMIEGPGLRQPGDPNGCPGRESDPNCAYTNLFALSGKYATNAGVDIVSTLYNRSSTGATTLHVYATSESGQAIEVDGASFARTQAIGEGGNYFASIALPANAAPEQVTVWNRSDTPPVSKTATPIDIVTISRAEYTIAHNATTGATLGTLVVEASSSDQFNDPVLTIEGRDVALVNGQATITNMTAPPQYVTVRSTAGGWDTEQVRVGGDTYPPIPVVAAAGANQTAIQGSLVTLDGNQSQGEVTDWQWTQIEGPSVTLSSPNSPVTTFTAPANPGTEPMTLRFSLTVEGPGGPSSNEVTVTVPATAAPEANAGADQQAVRGATVRLDASASTNAVSYSWTQQSGPSVVLTGASTATPSFVFPLRTDYSSADTATTIVLALTVNGPGGSDTDTVQITSRVDSVTIVSAQYTATSQQWRVRGTAAIEGQGNRAYVYQGTTCPAGPNGLRTDVPQFIGVADVVAVEGWEIRQTGPARITNTTPNNRVSVCTSAGGRQLNFTYRVR